MKKLIVRILIFIVILIGVDLSFGVLFDYLQTNAKGGSTGKINYISNITKADVIILGSSRAEHHYVPKVFEDSLHMSCYNCGRNGNGIILMYGRYKMLSQRYTPKLIVYDLNPHYDLQLNDNSSYLTFLKPFYNKCGIDSIIWNVDANERYKMLSHLYRYNYRILEVCTDYFSHSQLDNNNGYQSIRDTMKYTPQIQPNKINDLKLDRLKMYYFERLIKECKGKTKLVIIASPRYKGHHDSSFNPIIRLCKRYGVPFIDYNSDPEFVDNINYFGDSVHMNDAGAETFTKKIMKEIKQYL
jgi:hypothetical protein